MRVTVYLHSQKTVVAHWNVDNPVPVLTQYAEYDPNESVDSYLGTEDEVSVVLHASRCAFHRFPIHVDEDRLQRRNFELGLCLPSVDIGLDVIRDVKTPPISNGISWHALFVVSKTEIERTRTILLSESDFLVDVEQDIEAARISVPRQDSPWLCLGLRGDRWFWALIGSDHVLRHVSSVAYSDAVSLESTILAAKQETQNLFGCTVERVMLFGDSLTKAGIDQVRGELQKQDVLISRLNPFRRVRTSLSEVDQNKIIARSHLLGPIVAPVLTSVTTDLL